MLYTRIMRSHNLHFLYILRFLFKYYYSSLAMCVYLYCCQNYFNTCTVCFSRGCMMIFCSMINLYEVCGILQWLILQPNVLIPLLIFYKIFHISHAMCFYTFKIQSSLLNGYSTITMNEQWTIPHNELLSVSFLNTNESFPKP